MSTIPELAPAEFAARWPDYPNADVTLLDVREPYERELASVTGTLNIPMAEVPANLERLSTDGPTVVMCHGGLRSRNVAEFLRARGFDSVYNLSGGIDAWSATLDPTVPRY